MVRALDTASTLFQSRTGMVLPRGTFRSSIEVIKIFTTFEFSRLAFLLLILSKTGYVKKLPLEDLLPPILNFDTIILPQKTYLPINISNLIM